MKLNAETLNQSAKFGLLSLSVRDRKPQHILLKENGNGTNPVKYMNEALKQTVTTVFSKYHTIHARYAFQLEDWFQCLQYTNL